MKPGLDLNLLTVFDALWREGNVTRAAERLGLGQPAVSSALARLRAAFGDELFVRTPTGIAPTARAHRIAEEVGQALEHVTRALTAEERFDPARSHRTFSIAASDYADIVILPRLMRRVRAEAPHVDLRIVSLGWTEAAERIDRGQVTLGIFQERPIPKRLSLAPLYCERFVCIARAGHPDIGSSLDAETYATLPHAVFSLTGEPAGPLDRALREAGVTRRSALTVAHFSALEAIVRDTDLIATVAGRIAAHFAVHGGVAVHGLPVPLPGWTLALYWSRRDDADPGCSWLRSLIRDVCRST